MVVRVQVRVGTFLQVVLVLILLIASRTWTVTRDTKFLGLSPSRARD